MYTKYVEIMGVCAKTIFSEMTGIGIRSSKVDKEEFRTSSFPVAQVISYEHRDDPNIRGHFILGFPDEKMALSVASSVAKNMGLPALDSLDETALDVLGEFVNTVVGRTISTWDRMGMPVLFGPPSPLQEAQLSQTVGFKFETYQIILQLAFSQVVFQVSFNEPCGEHNEKKRVLVVDDSKVIRNMVRGNLEEAGFEVEDAQDGLQAAKLHKSFAPHVTVMDLNMPKMGGFDAITTIRKRAPEAKFILLTSSSRTDEVVHAKTLKVSGYLVKPVSREKLLDAVKRTVT